MIDQFYLKSLKEKRKKVLDSLLSRFLLRGRGIFHLTWRKIKKNDKFYTLPEALRMQDLRFNFHNFLGGVPLNHPREFG